MLNRYANRWPVKRMAAMDRMVLRLGVLELATQLEVPPGVCLSEAVELGRPLRQHRRHPEVRQRDPRQGRRRGARRRAPAVAADRGRRLRHGRGHPALDRAGDPGLPSRARPPGGRRRRPSPSPSRCTATPCAAASAPRSGRPRSADASPRPTTGSTPTPVARCGSRPSGAVDDDVVAIVQGLRDAGQRVAVFSNATTKLEVDMGAMGIAELFHDVCNSSTIGLMKPDVASFEHVADEVLGVAPERLLFVDDRLENVAGAVDAGLARRADARRGRSGRACCAAWACRVLPTPPEGLRHWRRRRRAGPRGCMARPRHHQLEPATCPPGRGDVDRRRGRALGAPPRPRPGDRPAGRARRSARTCRTGRDEGTDPPVSPARSGCPASPPTRPEPSSGCGSPPRTGAPGSPAGRRAHGGWVGARPGRPRARPGLGSHRSGQHRGRRRCSPGSDGSARGRRPACRSGRHPTLLLR